MAALANGTVLAGYRVDGVLGEGGMGTVYRATQLSLDRPIALKVLTAAFSTDEGFRERFRREGLLQAALDHPHIVTVYEAGETDEGLFLAMRIIDGPTLKDLVVRGELDTRRALRLLTQVAEALDAAHEAGLTHRDVKPQNVLIGPRDNAYLTDFGLTKAPDDSRVTETGHFVGTIDYVSPEQARGEAADVRSDVYALAGVLYECLTGQIPFPRPTEERALMAHLTDPPPRPTDLRPDLPPAIDEVIAKGMAKDPDERYSSASELLLEARRAFGGAVAPAAVGAGGNGSPGGGSATATRMAVAPGAATRPAGVAPGAVTRQVGVGAPVEAVPPRERKGMLVALIAGLAVVGLVVGIVAGGSSKSKPAPALADSASAGAVELSFPSTWQRLGIVPTVPGMSFSQPLALAPVQAGGERLVAGTVSAGDPTLLPAGFRAAVASLPAGTPVRLGTIAGLRYAALTVRGVSGPVTIYAVPSTAGVVTIACVNPGTSNDCDRIAASLRLTGATPFSLAADPAYASRLGAVLGPLKTARTSAEAALAAATTPSDQAHALRLLSDAYRTASRGVGALPSSPAVQDANGAIATAFAALAAEYRRAAAAANAGDSATYQTASGAISRDGSKVVAALGRLKQAGYTIAS
jgi:hypothetical protein